ncbi:uncharacterized protein Dvar_27670 [Desulfosarcina variabilis str. Montpellier]|uniref:hypothetical protein n=1 Tax=Desulfosarcina variabilis TaxID=2300 RepID=UPI003AFA3651
MGNMLAYYDMYPGDIMVKHGDQDFKKESSFTDKITSGFIISLQSFRYIFSPHRWKTDNPKYSHIAIYKGDGVILEDGLGGIHERDASAIMYEVFRYSDTKIAIKALNKVNRWFKSNKKIYHGYGVGKFPGICLGSSNYGVGAKIKANIEKQFPKTKSKMVCSEMIIKAYHEAAKKYHKDPKEVIDQDPSRTSPMRLEANLRSKSKAKGKKGWYYVGTIRRSTLELAKYIGDIPVLPA